MTSTRRQTKFIKLSDVNKVGQIAAMSLCLATGAGCQYSTPYVFTEREFDRSSADFNKEPVDRSSVMICMSPFADPSEKVLDLADQECQKYGKVARFSERQFGKCPLLISSAAMFRCLAPLPSTPEAVRK